MENTTSRLEKEILAAVLQSKDAYDLFERIGEPGDFSPLGRTVYGAVAEYRNVDPDIGECSRDHVEARLLGRLTNDKHAGPIREYLHGLPQDVSVANVERSIREVHRASVDAKLSLALANGAPEEEKQRLWKEREESGESRVETKEPSSLLDVLSPEYLEGLQEEGNDNEFIKLWPRVLNDRLEGGALRGHHVLVFARPETGKTLFSINLTAGFLHQGLNVLYVGNEEPAADYRDRIYGRLLKVGKAFVRDNRADVSAALARANIGRVHLAEATSFGDVRRSLESGSFSVVILDQIRNMRLSSESRTAELEAAGIEARSIAKEYNVLVVSITQAGNSADGKVYLEMGDVDSSKTGLPASADLMIGLGCDEPMKANGLLGVSLPKNKLSGLHDRFTVACNFQTGVVE